MTQREENRAWLEQMSTKYPNGWESQFISLFGIEGALDVLAGQSGDPFGIDLTHRPFARNRELKFLVSEARAAVREMTRALHEHVWAAMEKAKAGR